MQLSKCTWESRASLPLFEFRYLPSIFGFALYCAIWLACDTADEDQAGADDEFRNLVLSWRRATSLVDIA